VTRSRSLLRPSPALTALAGLLLCTAADVAAQPEFSGASPVPVGSAYPVTQNNPLTELAAALVAGPAAVEKLRGANVGGDRYQLRLTVPMMEQCVVTQNELDVACYGDRPTEYIAHGVFDTLLVQLREALPSTAWEEVQREPRRAWIRRVRFRHEESGARIDLDMSRQEDGGFRVWLWGFPASGAT
jgi:hypothetical protein